MKNKKNIIIISIISAALIVLMIIIALFAGCSKNTTSTPDEATADTATSDTASTVENTTLNIEAQAITDNGLSIDKDGNVVDKDGKKVEMSEDGKVKIKTDDGKTVEVSTNDIKNADSKTDSDGSGTSDNGKSSTNTSKSNSSDNNSGSSSGSSSSKSDTQKQDDNDGKTYHEAVYKTVHHDAETEQVWVVDEAAYTYEEPVYETHDRTICNTCGADITERPAGLTHRENHLLNGENSSFHNEWIQVQVGTKTVSVPEKGHYETKIIKEAYDEQVLVKEAGWY